MFSGQYFLALYVLFKSEGIVFTCPHIPQCNIRGIKNVQVFTFERCLLVSYISLLLSDKSAILSKLNSFKI